MPITDPFFHAGWNPLAGNPLVTRADIETALRDLVTPLDRYYSPGCARVRLSTAAAHFDRAAADLEGFARPLWGLAPAAVGGADWIDWPRIARGLANGVDPTHPEYWGAVIDLDQRMVELAAIGYALRLAPDKIWEPLSPQARDNLCRYMLDARVHEFSTNNWRFFRLMIDLGLNAVGVDVDPAPAEEYLADIEALYLGDGWYRDGPTSRVDHYIPFAMHFYGLLLSAYGDRHEYSGKWRDRAREFAPDFAAWFSDDGAAIPFGRSMTYRFAMGAFWGALAVADVEALPWGEMRGLWLRHLRWWSHHGIADRDGVLSIGYTYPNLLMSEPYNSAGSPYWALKAFAPLALPQTHPFWTSEERGLSTSSGVLRQRHPGALLFHPPGDAVMLVSGQSTDESFRACAEKYSKFAYSARYGFGIENDATRFADAAFESMLGLSDDGHHFRVRGAQNEARIGDDMLYSTWEPWPDVSVETWLIATPPGHMRIHRIKSPRPLWSTEGGFAIGRTDGNRDGVALDGNAAIVETVTDAAAIRDLGSTMDRTAQIKRTQPNTNLVVARAWVPQLVCKIPAGETVLRTYVVASPDRDAVRDAYENHPSPPRMEILVAAAKAAETVGAVYDRNAVAP